MIDIKRFITGLITKVVLAKTAKTIEAVDEMLKDVREESPEELAEWAKFVEENDKRLALKKNS